MYSYVGGNPISNVDPSGLFQVTFGLHISGPFGIAVTFGLNSGQFNLGEVTGLAVGNFLNVDPSDSGCKSSGVHQIDMAQGALGAGEGLEGSVTLDSTAGTVSSQLSLQNPFAPANSFSYGMVNGSFVSASPNFSIGAGAIFGTGYQAYFSVP